MTKITKILQNNFHIILLLFFTFSFLYIPDHSLDQDLGRHIKLGEIIVNTKQVPSTNLFSYTFPDFKFINHHFLFEVLVYLGQGALGIYNLIIIKILIILSAVFLTLKNIQSPSKFLSLPVAFIFLHLLRERTELRPEIFSFLFTALTFYILNKFEKEGSRLVFLLPIVQLLWINTHIYFPLGLMLQVIFLIHFFFQKRVKYLKYLSIILISSLLLSFVNPNGLSGFLYPLKVFDNYGYTIAENQNLFFLESLGFNNPNFLFAKLVALTIIVSILLQFLSHNLSVKNLLISLLGLLLALIHVRSFPYLIFLSLPAVLTNLNFPKITKWSKLIAAGFVFLLLLESYFYLSGDYYQYKDQDKDNQIKVVEHGKSALDFTLKNNLPGPIFNNFDIGSYIIYRGYPKTLVFVDGRPEGYPQEFFQQVYIPVQENPRNFQTLDKQLNFQTIIFSHTDQTPWGKNFLSLITKDPNFKTIYLDDFMIILVKNNIVQDKNLKPLDFNTITPSDYQFDHPLSYTRLALFLLNNQADTAAYLFAKKALELSPQSPINNLLISALLQQESNLNKAFQVKTYQEKTNNFVWW